MVRLDHVTIEQPFLLEGGDILGAHWAGRTLQVVRYDIEGNLIFSVNVDDFADRPGAVQMETAVYGNSRQYRLPVSYVAPPPEDTLFYRLYCVDHQGMLQWTHETIHSDTIPGNQGVQELAKAIEDSAGTTLFAYEFTTDSSAADVILERIGPDGVMRWHHRFYSHYSDVVYLEDTFEDVATSEIGEICLMATVPDQMAMETRTKSMCKLIDISGEPFFTWRHGRTYGYGIRAVNCLPRSGSGFFTTFHAGADFSRCGQDQFYSVSSPTYYEIGLYGDAHPQSGLEEYPALFK
ncbi:hypothetical protein GF324_10285, partial [bacterium]|nr:hypothetical protein [bacterium]